LVIASTLSDYQALLDNYLKINNAPGTAEASSDDYYIVDADFASLNMENLRRTYTWKGELLFDIFPNNWSRCYDIVYYANVALQGLQKIEMNAANNITYDNVKGQAFFLRGFAMSQAAVLWCKSYDRSTASTDLGLPLRMNPDFNEPSVRSSLQQTYDQILTDLKMAAQVLPNTAVHVMRPSKAAAYGALARVYLSMREYENALLYADSSLAVYNKLLDYNTLNATATFPIAAYNTEIIYQTEMATPPLLGNTRGKIDSTLYKQYATDDLRKTIFFKNNNNGTFGFKGSYDASANLFAGMATDEMYLIRAEGYARKGNITNAMNDLDTLLIKRWKKGTLISSTASSPLEAINKILLERRKELLMRGIRWSDLKRLNLEGANIILKRIINGQTYILLPNDVKYALPIPEDIINLTGMPQNPNNVEATVAQTFNQGTIPKKGCNLFRGPFFGYFFWTSKKSDKQKKEKIK
jgi:tetratricopeptide (TPR) repeat protein